MSDGISFIISTLGSLCDCAFWIAVIGGAVWFFVFRDKGDADGGNPGDADETPGAGAAASSSGDDPEDVATVVAPQPPSAKPGAGSEPARPPRTAGATIIAFDDDDLLDD